MTAIERHTGNTLALTDDHYLNRIPQLADQLARSSMCPDTFKNKPAEIAIIGYALADNGIRLSVNTLPQCYVVHGRPGYMAQIQTAMASMHGVDIHPIGHKCDDTSATVEVLTVNGRRHEVTFTMAEAEKAGLTTSKMYKTWPASMLVARATTRAIGWYCPAVKLGLAGSVNSEELDTIDADIVEDDEPETGELVPFAEAAHQLIATYISLGLTVDDAKPLAKQLWESHGLERGDSISRTRLDLIIALLTASQPRLFEPEVAEPEAVDNVE